VEIDIKGLDKLINKLDSTDIIAALEPPMHKAMFRLQTPLATYPPKPTNSKYVRTGTLGRRWLIDVDARSDEITGKVGNNTEYGPQVQAAKFQKPIFKRIGWPTDEGVLNQQLPAIIKDFQDAIDDEVSK
jgi:hypothetical protein